MDVFENLWYSYFRNMVQNCCLLARGGSIEEKFRGNFLKIFDKPKKKLVQIIKGIAG